MTNNNVLSDAFIESVAGFVAGVASTLVTHPLDLIKTRLQGKQFISPNLVGNSVSWALYFVSYDKLKSGIQAYHGRRYRLSYYDFFLASGAAGTTLDRYSMIPERTLTFFASQELLLLFLQILSG